MVRSAAQLIRRQGVSGTGMRQIVLAAEAPRGSLQHYFPGGKEELVAEALSWMGGIAARRVRRHLETLDPATPGALLSAIVNDWRVDLGAEGFAAGCPLVAAAADNATGSAQLRDVIRKAFDGWQEPLSAALEALGVPGRRAPNLALLIISALEGAIILSRIRKDTHPLDVLVAEMGPVLDSTVTRPRSHPAPGQPPPGLPAPGQPAPGQPAPGQPAPGQPEPARKGKGPSGR
jgi:AcrR family transcriptional regulator